MAELPIPRAGENLADASAPPPSILTVREPPRGQGKPGAEVKVDLSKPLPTSSTAVRLELGLLESGQNILSKKLVELDKVTKQFNFKPTFGQAIGRTDEDFAKNWKRFFAVILGIDALNVPVDERDVEETSMTREQLAAIAELDDVKEQLELVSQRVEALGVRDGLFFIMPSLAEFTEGELVKQLDGELLTVLITNKEDRAFVLQQVKIIRDRNAPENIDPATRQKILDQLMTSRSISAYGIMALGNRDLLATAIQVTTPQLPEGVSHEQMRRLLEANGIPSPQSAEYIAERGEYIERVINALIEYKVRSAVVQSDIKNIELDNLATELKREYWASIAANPGMALMLPFQYFEHKLYKPFGGHAQSNLRTVFSGFGLENTALGSFFGTNDRQARQFDLAFSNHKAGGLNAWEATGAAFDDVDSNGWGKFILEILGSPDTYFGMGIYTKIFRPVPILNHAVRGFERGWVKTVDAPFEWLARGGAVRLVVDPAFKLAGRTPPQHLIPRLPKHISDRYSVDNFDTVVKGVEQGLGREWGKVSGDEVRAAMRTARDLLLREPQTHNPLGQAARVLLDRPHLSQEFVDDFFTQMGADANSKLGPDAASYLDSILNWTTTNPGSTVISLEESARLLVRWMGKDGGDTVLVERVQDMIIAYRNQLFDSFDELLNFGDDYDLFTKKILSHGKQISEINQLNPISTQRSRTAMMVSQFINIPVLGRTAALFTGLNRFQYGWARLYLATATYSGMNWIEMSGKAAYLGINPVWEGNALDMFRAWSQGETMPLMFRTADLYQLQLAPISNSKRLSRAREEGLTDAAFKRQDKSQAAVWKDFLVDIPDKFLVRAGGRVGMNMAANMYQGLVMKQLQSDAIIGPIYQRTARIIQNHVSDLSAFLDDKAIKQLREETIRRVIMDVKGLPFLAKDFHSGVIYSSRVYDMASKYQSLGIEIADHLLNMTREGTLFPALLDDTLDDHMREVLWRQAFSQPDVASPAIEKMVDGLVNYTPANFYPEFAFQFRSAQEIHEVVSQTLLTQMRGVRFYTRELPNNAQRLEKRNNHWNTSVVPFIQRAQQDLSKLLGHLESTQRTFNLTDARNADLRAMIQMMKSTGDEWSGMSSNMTTRMAKLATERDVIINKLRAKGTKNLMDSPEIAHWHEKVFRAQDEIFDKAAKKIAVFSATSSSIGMTIDGTKLPPIIDAAARPLSVNDVAQLFGGNNSAVTAGMMLPELMAFRTKEDFIEQVFMRAERVATAGNSTALDMGFDRAKIEELYRRIIRRMHADSENPFGSRFTEWEALRNELTSFGQSKHLVAGPDSQLAIQDYVEKVTLDLQSDPATRLLYEPDTYTTPSFEGLEDEVEGFMNLIGQGSLDAAEDSLGIMDVARRREVISQALDEFRDDKRKLLDKVIEDPLQPTGHFEGIEEIVRFSGMPGDLGILNASRKIAGAVESAESTLPDSFRQLLSDWRMRTIFNEDQQRIRDDLLDKFVNDPRTAEYRKIIQEAFREAFPDQDTVKVWRGSSPRGTMNEIPTEGVSVTLKPNIAGMFADFAQARSGSGVIESFDVPIERFMFMADIGEAEFIITTPGKVPDTANLDDALEGLGRMIGRNLEPETPIGTKFKEAKHRAYERARDEFNLNMPNYDNPNAFNAAMRFVFPFWTYEAHRWTFLPRVAVRTPGVYHAWGSYNETSDQGYIGIPGVPFQINMLRNMITQGGGRRILNRDYPEFYDQFPEVANIVDQAGRYGFYPNIYVSGFMATGFSNKEGVWQTGEVLPPTVSSALNVLSAAAPDNIFVNGLRELLLPNRFRDFKKVRLVTMAGSDGAMILNKLKNNIALDDDEQIAWTSAERRVALLEVFDIQTGLTRLKPPEIEQARELAKQIIVNWSGYPITEELYDEARRVGYPLEENFPFPAGLNDALNSVDEVARWRGQSTHLRESSVGIEISQLALFWDGVEERRTDINIVALEWDDKLRAGTITLDRWGFERKELRGEMSAYIEERKQSEMFRGVNIDFEDRIQFAQDHHVLPPIRSSQEELIAIYFDAEPDDFEFFNDDTGKFEIDWVGFYAYRKAIEEALPDSELAEFKERISKWDTLLDQQRRYDYEEYITPYKAIFATVLKNFDKDQIALIKEFYSTDSSERREVLRAIPTVEGSDQLLIATFQSQSNRLKRVIRRSDPEMDARLALWGEITTPISEEARIIQRRLWNQYGFKGREA